MLKVFFSFFGQDKWPEFIKAEAYFFFLKYGMKISLPYLFILSLFLNLSLQFPLSLSLSQYFFLIRLLSPSRSLLSFFLPSIILSFSFTLHQVRLPAFPFFSEERNNCQCCWGCGPAEMNVNRGLENVDQTQLLLVSGNLVLQKSFFEKDAF